MYVLVSVDDKEFMQWLEMVSKVRPVKQIQQFFSIFDTIFNIGILFLI